VVLRVSRRRLRRTSLTSSSTIKCGLFGSIDWWVLFWNLVVRIEIYSFKIFVSHVRLNYNE
jgi:hypothetical protein